MIISASRRTDIPAFYSTWFMNRIRAGFCNVPNPVNMKQVTRVPLSPQDVDAIVFWTRNPKPMFRYLIELDGLGYRYYFQFTVVDNHREVDKSSPTLEFAISAFQELAGLIGGSRVIWRYDPIILTEQTGVQFHIDKFGEIALRLQGATNRCVISIVDIYRKASHRLMKLNQKGIRIFDYDGRPNDRFAQMIITMRQISELSKINIYSCAETLDLIQYGIEPGKCIDDELISELFNLTIPGTKDRTQRDACGCITSRDIGMYDSCIFGCQYCYATSSFDKARSNFETHQPDSPSLIGWYDTYGDNGSISQLPLPLEASNAAAQSVPTDTRRTK